MIPNVHNFQVHWKGSIKVTDGSERHPRCQSVFRRGRGFRTRILNDILLHEAPRLRIGNRANRGEESIRKSAYGCN